MLEIQHTVKVEVGHCQSELCKCCYHCHCLDFGTFNVKYLKALPALYVVIPFNLTVLVTVD